MKRKNITNTKSNIMIRHIFDKMIYIFRASISYENDLTIVTSGRDWLWGPSPKSKMAPMSPK